MRAAGSVGGRLLAVLLVVAGSAAALAMLATVETSEIPTVEQLLAPAEVAEIERIREEFGREPDLVLVAVRRAAAPLADERLAWLAGQLGAVDGVARAWSPARTGFGRPEPSTGLILVELEAGATDLTPARTLSAAIERVLARSASADETMHVVGTPQVRVATWETARHDLRRILPLLVLAVVLVPVLFFGTPGAVLFPLVLAALTTAATLLAYRWVSGPLNALALLLVPLLWSVATLDAMHLYVRARQRLSIARARAELALPCLLTTLTTAGGFAALALQGESRLVRSFGAWAAAGTCFAYLLTFTAGSALLALAPARRPPPRWPARFALGVVVFSERRAPAVRAAWLVAAVAAALWAAGLRVDVAFPHVFAPGQPAARELAAVEAIAGTDLMPLEVYLEASDERGRAPESLARAFLITTHFAGTFAATRAILPRDLLDGAALPAPETTFAELQRDPRLAPWLRFDAGLARFQLHFARTDLAHREERVRWLRHFDETVLDHHRMSFGGPGYTYPLAERQGVRGTLVGGLLALLVVGGALTWPFRRIGVLVAALLGNLLPLLLVGGLMGAAGLPWSLALVALPAVLLALAVDDTLHLLWPLRGRARPGRRLLHRGVREAAPAVLATTVVLAACVATLLLSGLRANRDLGLLLPVGLLLAVACDLSLVPALLTGSRRRSARRPP